MRIVEYLDGLVDNVENNHRVAPATILNRARSLMVYRIDKLVSDLDTGTTDEAANLQPALNRLIQGFSVIKARRPIGVMTS